MTKIRTHKVCGKQVFIGLDDSKRSWKVCARSGGTIVDESSLEATFSVLNQYLNNNFPECKITVMYEASFRGFSLHDQLVENGFHCVVTPPHTLTVELCRRQKNDRIDSRRLAKNLENNDYKICAVPDKTTRADRQLSRQYAQVQKDYVRMCNRIRRALEFHGLDTAFQIGAWSVARYREAEQYVKRSELEVSLQIAFDHYFNQLWYLLDLKKKILKQLNEISKNTTYSKNMSLLKSAPGIGSLTAIRLLLEWGDVSRFSRKETFANFTGLVPSEYSSGEIEHRGHITKQGCKGVRSWLIESAWHAIRKDPILKEKYLSVRARTGSGKKAIVAVARKLAIRLRTLLLTQSEYQIGLEY